MIARIWRGRTRIPDADRYVRYVNETGVRDQRATPGNLGSLVLCRDIDEQVEIIVLSLWNELEDIHAFAGDRIERAIYYPEDERYLVEMPERLEHYRVETLALSKATMP